MTCLDKMAAAAVKTETAKEVAGLRTMPIISPVRRAPSGNVCLLFFQITLEMKESRISAVPMLVATVARPLRKPACRLPAAKRTKRMVVTYRFGVRM